MKASRRTVMPKSRSRIKRRTFRWLSCAKKAVVKTSKRAQSPYAKESAESSREDSAVAAIANVCQGIQQPARSTSTRKWRGTGLKGATRNSVSITISN